MHSTVFVYSDKANYFWALLGILSQYFIRSTGLPYKACEGKENLYLIHTSGAQAYKAYDQSL